uniref:Uncharacterized protein n=1 Tax=Anguilla anguilla TaxID=7936 RepID=A0A0E9SBL9_ANGAN
MREGGAKGPTQVLPAPCLSISISSVCGSGYLWGLLVRVSGGDDQFAR